MQAGMYIAYTGARAAEKKIEQIANNLANASSPGFKQDRTVSSGVVPMAFALGPDRASISGETPGARLLYSAPAVHFVDHSPGPTHPTGNPFDLAIEGDAFFTVQTPQGVRLSRAGNFHVDGAGDLAAPSGAKLLGQGGPIRVGEGSLSVTREGQVFVDGVPVDTLRLQRVDDAQKLVKTGNGLFEVPPDVPLSPADPAVAVVQAALEESNVSAVSGMTDMIEASRMFEAYMKMITVVSELASRATNDLGRV